MVISDLCTPDTLEQLRGDRMHWFPHRIEFELGQAVTRAHRRHYLAMFVATDMVYAQSSCPPGASLPLVGYLDNGGVSGFLYEDGSYRSDLPFVIGTPDDRLGCLAAVFVVAFDRQHAVSRS